MEPPPPRSFVPIAKAGSFGGVPCIYTQTPMPCAQPLMQMMVEPQPPSPVQLEPAAADLSFKAAELAGYYYAQQPAPLPLPVTQQYLIGPGGNIYALNPQLFYPPAAAAAAGPSIYPQQQLLQSVMLPADGSNGMAPAGVMCGYAAAAASSSACADAVDVGTQSENVSYKPQQEHLLHMENAGRCSFTCAQLGPLYSQQQQQQQQRQHPPFARGLLSSQSYPSNQSVPTSQLSFQSSFSGASAIPESELSAASGAGGEQSESLSLSASASASATTALQLQIEPLMDYAAEQQTHPVAGPALQLVSLEAPAAASVLHPLVGSHAQFLAQQPSYFAPNAAYASQWAMQQHQNQIQNQTLNQTLNQNQLVGVGEQQAPSGERSNQMVMVLCPLDQVRVARPLTLRLSLDNSLATRASKD